MYMYLALSSTRSRIFHLSYVGRGGGRQKRMMRVGRSGAEPPMLGWAVEREMEVGGGGGGRGREREGR